LELRQLEYFMVLSEELHFTRAAQRLHISQPTLSQQIKVLEQTIGVLLFNRIGKKITLSKAGEILHAQCQHIFSTLEQTKIQLQALDSQDHEQLRIGAMPGAIYDLISLSVLHYIEQFPSAPAKVLAHQQVTTLLEDNEVDIAFSYHEDNKINGRFVEIPLYDEGFVFVTHRSHPLLQHDTLTWDSISNEPLVLFPESHDSRKLLKKALQEQPTDLQLILETENTHAMLHFLEQRLGSTVMLRSLYSQLRNPYIEARPIDSNIVKEVVLIIPKKEKLPYAIKEYLPMFERFLGTKGIETKDRMSLLLLSNDSFSL
jgi:LysR family transcriptional regulator, cyn operon transcriptional activator